MGRQPPPVLDDALQVVGNGGGGSKDDDVTGKYVDRVYLCRQQYIDDRRLQARITLHENYSTNAERMMPWLFRMYDLRPDAHILDVGCGPGSLWLENQTNLPDGLQVILGDLAIGMVSAARKYLGSGPFAFGQLDAMALPFPANHFDVVIANFMLYHLADPLLALAEFRRVLRPAGRIYAATNGADHMRALRDIIRDLDAAADVSHAGRTFSLENGKALLELMFVDVRRTLRDDNLAVTDVEPLLDYILSMDRSEKLAADPGILRHELQTRLTRGGSIQIEKSVGFFSARKAHTWR